MELPPLPNPAPGTYRGQGHAHIDFDRNCKRCSFRGEEHVPVGGAGPDDLSKVKLIVVSDYPGHYEVKQGFPFVPQAPGYTKKNRGVIRWPNAGASLRHIIYSHLGLNSYTDCWLTNVLKCNPAQHSGKVQAVQAKVCLSTWFYGELEALFASTPAPVWVAGNLAFSCFRYAYKDFWQVQRHSLNDLRGQVVEWRGRPIVFTYNPAAYCRSEFRQAIEHKGKIVEARPLYAGVLPGSPWYFFLEDIKPLETLCKS